jgi:hypothetical protein
MGVGYSEATKQVETISNRCRAATNASILNTETSMGGEKNLCVDRAVQRNEQRLRVSDREVVKQ